MKLFVSYFKDVLEISFRISLFVSKLLGRELSVIETKLKVQSPIRQTFPIFIRPKSLKFKLFS